MGQELDPRFRLELLNQALARHDATRHLRGMPGDGARSAGGVKTIMESHLTFAAKLSSDWGSPLTPEKTFHDSLPKKLIQKKQKTALRTPSLERILSSDYLVFTGRGCQLLDSIQYFSVIGE